MRHGLASADLATQGAVGGFVVTSGVYTEEAVAIAQGGNARLIDGARLKGWIGRVRPIQAGAVSSRGRKPASVKPTAGRSGTDALACPVCQSRMVRRQARQGKNAGREF